MEVWQQILPYVGWVIAGGVAVSLGGILASVHNTRLKIKHGYPIEGMWGQSLKPGTDAESKVRSRMGERVRLDHERTDPLLGAGLEVMELVRACHHLGSIEPQDGIERAGRRIHR